MASTILLIIAAVLFAIAAFGTRTPVHLGWAGAFFLAIALALGGGGLE